MTAAPTDTIAATCARLWATLTTEQPTTSPDLTDLVLDTVRSALAPHERDAYPLLLTAFVEAERDHLARVIRECGPASSFRHGVTWGDHPYLLVHSPAIAAVLERLTECPFRFESVWDEQWESDAMVEELRGLVP